MLEEEQIKDIDEGKKATTFKGERKNKPRHRGINRNSKALN